MTSSTKVNNQWAEGLKNKARATIPPMSEPPTPQATVHQKPMGLGPGTAKRPRAPMTSPPMRMLMIRNTDP